MKNIKYVLLTLLILACASSSAWARMGVLALGGGVPANSPYLVDDFINTAGTALTSHTPNPGPGGSWFVNTTNFKIVTSPDSAAEVSTGTGGYIAYNDATANGADTEIKGNVRINSTLNRGAGLCLAMTSSFSGYCAFVTTNGLLAILEFVGGVGTTLNSVTLNTAHSTSRVYPMTFSRVNNVLTATLGDDSTTVSESDSTYSSAGHAGIYIWNTSSYVYNIEAE